VTFFSWKNNDIDDITVLFSVSHIYTDVKCYRVRVGSTDALRIVCNILIDILQECIYRLYVTTAIVYCACLI